MPESDSTNDFLDLTKSQMAIWTGQKLNPGVPLYNMVFTFELSGPIQVNSFQRSFQALVNKSDAMRTIFLLKEDKLQQKTEEFLSSKIEFIDWSSNNISDEKFNEWVSNRMRIEFDLSKCLFDAVLIKITESSFFFYLNQHHLITDAWSISIQYKALAELYNLCIHQKDIQNYNLPTFADYVKFEKRNRLKLKRSSVENYWNQALQSTPQALKLFGKTFKGANTYSKRVSVEIGEKRTQQLLQIAKTQGILLFTSQLTLFNIFATLLYAYIYRISGQKQIALGSPVHNRLSKTSKNTLGLFIELFPIISSVESQDTFITLLDRVKSQSVHFLTNAQTGSSDSDLSKSFNVVLNFITVAFSDFAGIPSRAKWRRPDHIDSHHALRLNVHDFNQAGNFILDFDINNSIIDNAIPNNLDGHFLRLLDAFIENPNQRIDSVAILSKLETKHLLELGNGIKEISKPEKSILDIWQNCVEVFPDRRAIQYNNQSFSYSELDRRSNLLANQLMQFGVKPSSKVGLFLNRSNDLIIGILGILKTGGAYVPLDPIYPIGRLDHIIQQADISIVVSHNNLKDKLKQKGIDILDINKPTQTLFSPPTVDVTPSNLAYVIFTSGSTGIPKGVMIEHSSVVHLVQKLGQRIYHRYPNPLNIALIAPVIFDASIQQIFGALLQGHTLHIAPECVRTDGNQLLQFYKDFNIDVTDGTPAHLKLLLASNTISLLPKHFIIGGEALPAKLVIEFQEKFSDSSFIISNIYGVAECTVDSLSYDLNNNDEINSATVPIGRPLPNERVYILNTANQLQPYGTPGEITIGGGSVGRGYLNADKNTNLKFIDNPFLPNERIFKTGDLGYYLPDGNIQYLGRKDSQVNINGYRIELGEIEHQILAFKKINPVKELSVIQPVINNRCSQCLLHKAHPNVTLNSIGICNVCQEFSQKKEKALKYFKSQKELDDLITEAKKNSTSKYDCLLLYSGGKDSSYVLYKLVKMGLRVLAFTFDNGYISKAAFDNIKRQTKQLGVDSIIRKTNRMDDIFVESLKSDHTVCSGCFKSLTSISTKIAYEKGINVIVTGLSRGQIFETKLEALINENTFEVSKIEERLIQFRKMFHTAKDRTKQILDIELGNIQFEKIHFIDYFRYDNTPIFQIKNFLKQQDSYWQKPKDTGFCSSNCQMNDVGICIHSKEKGFHNYEAPLSWDIRLGICTRSEALLEIAPIKNVKKVNHLLDKIGFFKKEIRDVVAIARSDQNDNDSLYAYFVASQPVDVIDLREHLAKSLPEYMIPKAFIQLEKIPMTVNGKIDKNGLPFPNERPSINTKYEAPKTEIEKAVFNIWSKVLGIKNIGIHDSYLHLGGNSMTAIRITTRINNMLELDLSLNIIFEKPTIASLSKHIEETIFMLLQD